MRHLSLILKHFPSTSSGAFIQPITYRFACRLYLMLISSKHLAVTCFLNDTNNTFIRPVSGSNSLTCREDIAHRIELTIFLSGLYTMGHESSGGNAYRLYLQDDLASSNLKYVKPLISGSVSDELHKGHTAIRSGLFFLPFA